MSAMCPGCGSPFVSLGAALPGAFGCNGCRGFWLDLPLHPWALALVTEQGVPVVGGHPSGGCPRCNVALRAERVAGPVASVVHRCGQHGAWSAWNGIGAVADVAMRAALARALCANDPVALHGLAFLAERLAEGDDHLLKRRVIHAIGRRPSTTIGFGSVADGGVVVIQADGSHETLIAATSPWLMTKLVAVLLGVTFALIILVMAFVSDDVLIVGGMLVLFYVIATAMFATIALGTEQTRIVFDCMARQIHIQRGAASVIPVPAFFAAATRVEVHAHINYSDQFNVMVILPTAELWVDQRVDHDKAIVMAQRVAGVLRVAFDPTLRRSE